MIWVRLLAVGFLILPLISGCSGKPAKPPRYKVSGRLTSGGQALRTKPMVGMIQVIFYPMPEGPRPADPIRARVEGVYGRVNEEGEYTVHDGLPAGKYIVAVRQLNEGPQGADALKDKFSFKNSKIIEEISEDRDLDIELDKYR
jgi:hypothetical protein